MNTTLEEMKNVDVRTIDPSKLVDIRDVKVNPELSREERILDFVRQIKNPFCYKCGKVVVKVSYSETEETLEDKLEKYLLSL